MIELGASEIKQLDDFVAALADVRTPDDMFPPDQPEGGVREPRNPVVPPIIGCECIKLARVYDLQAARQRQLGHSALLMRQIDELVPA